MFRRTRLTKSERRPHRVAMLACDNAQILDITGPLEVSDAYREAGHIDTLLIAAAGLLKHRPATTRLAYCDRLGQMAPDTAVNADAIYVKSGRVYTSAGVTAGMDMALAMVEEDCGRPVALAVAVAQALVMFLKRPGGQSQFSRHLAAQHTRDERLGELELKSRPVAASVRNRICGVLS